MLFRANLLVVQLPLEEPTVQRQPKQNIYRFITLAQDEKLMFIRVFTKIDEFSLTLYSSRSALLISGSITWMSSNILLSITMAVDLLCGNNHTRVREINYK